MTEKVGVTRSSRSSSTRKLGLGARLDEAEDRSRRDNVDFYGIIDNLSETWAQTEEEILNILRQTPAECSSG